MITFYTMGGGWGHLTRVKTFIENKQIEEPYLIITSNSDAKLFFEEKHILLVSANEYTTKEDLSDKIKSSLLSFSFTDCYVDVFPKGILGELSEEIIPANNFKYLGRRLNWANYQERIEKPLPFKYAYVFEELEPSHHEFVQSHALNIEYIQLNYPTPDLSFSHSILDQEKPVWLIVHTSNEEELSMLVEHAQDIASIEQVEPLFVVLSNCNMDHSEVIELSFQEPINWFPQVNKVITGGGFNTWHQMSLWREKHICLPFKRDFDDQFWRVSNGIT